MNKTSAVRDRLREMAREAGPGGRLPTVRQLRHDFQVSLATLNSAMLDLEQEGVLQRRHGSGIYVSPNLGRRRIALVIDPVFFYAGSGSPTWSLMVEAAMREAHADGDILTLVFTRTDVPLNEGPGTDASVFSDGFLRDVARGAVDGVLGIGLSHAAARWLEQEGLVVVNYAGASAQYVLHDLMAGLEALLTHLSDAGFRRCAILGDPWENPRHEVVGLARRSGLEVVERPIAPPPATAIEAPRAGGSQVRSGFDTVQDWLRTGWSPSPDEVLISLDDMHSQGLLMGLQAAGLRIGEEVPFASHAVATSPVLLGWETRIWQMQFDHHLAVRLMRVMLDQRLREVEIQLPADVPSCVVPRRLPELCWMVGPVIVPPR